MPKWLLALLEVVGVALIAAGVSLWSVAAALVVVGVLLVVMCEAHT